MNNITLAVFIGMGATLTFDLWLLSLKYVFRTAPANTCLIGRWLLYMPEGIFKHSNINSAPKKKGECGVGWAAHYITGIIFAAGFIGWAGKDWLQNPTLIPALIFGMATAAFPFLIMQPAFGLGVAASKNAKPGWIRLRTLLNHVVFGMGLYFFGLLASWLLLTA